MAPALMPVFTPRSRCPGTRIALPLLLAAACVLAAAQPPAGQAPAGRQQPPRFRAAASFVQVDVYPTIDGRPVADLAKEDFEVLEDGVPQAVATFEHIAARPGADARVAEPRSLAESNDMAADPRNRLFVIFLDSYHVTDPAAWHDGRMRMPGSTVSRRPAERRLLGPQPIDKAIVSFLERAIGPTDLVAPMSPEMDASQMVFSRRPDRFAEWMSTAWARRFAWDDLDPEEERWGWCYPPDQTGDPFGCYRGILEEMVLRRREALTLKALDDTVTTLGKVREGRKAVLLVSEGWPMFRSNQQLARPLPRMSSEGCPAQPPAKPGIYVGPGGKLQSGGDPQNPQAGDPHECDAARVRLALLDNAADYRSLLDRANRETVSFYPIDPRGLAVFDTPMDAQPPGPMGATSKTAGVAEDAARLRGRLETLRNLASATDGFMSESNDLGASLKRVADDLSDYYLLGYNSTNAKLDGRFRRITVRVKRPGVQVRARRGYLAATQAEVAAMSASEAPVDPAATMRDSALAALGSTPAERPVKVAAGFDWAGQGPTLWAVVELGDAAAKDPAWLEGAGVDIKVAAGDRPAASGRGTLTPSSRLFAWRAEETLAAGDYSVRVTARATGGSTSGDQVAVAVPPRGSSTQAGTPRLYRRGPATGLAFVPTADRRFRRVERARVAVSIAGDTGDLSGRLLDRRGQPLAVPVTMTSSEESGVRSVVAEATLAPLAPGDYLVEVAFGAAGARQSVVTAIRIVP
jgi:VWFA-related protein